MKIRIISVGKPHDRHYEPAIADFEQRLSRHVQITWEFIPSSTIAEESAQLMKRSAGATTILLDEKGSHLDNPSLAGYIDRLQNGSVKELFILIGGAFGVTDDVHAHADMVWSLSPLVFPHQIVRLLVVEQLYRTYDILANGKYHHS